MAVLRAAAQPVTARRAGAASRRGQRVRAVAVGREAPAVDPAKLAAGLGLTEEEAAAVTYDAFEALLGDFDFGAVTKVGARVTGSIISVDGNRGAFVDVGGKAPAFLPAVEAAMSKPTKMADVLAAGQECEFVVIKDDSRSPSGAVTLSLKAILLEQAWGALRDLQAEDATIEALVVSSNRGGVVVEVNGIGGFIPSSHIVSMANREDLVGTTIPAKFLEVDEERERLVLSNRKASAESESESYNVGDVVVGTVQAVKPYGAFISIGGLSGLLHISQISHERITAVENVLSAGDQLKVMILSHDRERGRLSLSTKKLEPTPGDMLRNPELVFEKADEMAATFRERVAQAEAAAKAEEAELEKTFSV